jgi:cysteine-rich repeat protein
MKAGYFVFIILVVFVGIGLPLVFSAPKCGNGVVEGRFPADNYEECDDGNNVSGDGCSAECRVEFLERIYVAPYMGNIEGHFSEDWFFFYDRLVDYFEEEEIPVGATIYPATLDNPEFAPYAKSIYESPYMEFVQKAWTGLGKEQRIDELPFEEQREIISNGQEAFRSYMAGILGVNGSEVWVPVAYNAPQGRFTNDTRKALEELGFKIFFEMYMNDDLGPIEPTEKLDVLQYGVGLTTDGDAGPDTYFFQPGENLLELRDFYRDDLNMVYINGSRVVPVWVHHMDFESKTRPNIVDEEKWAIYTYLMGRIKEEPNLILVSPSEIWEMRH